MANDASASITLPAVLSVKELATALDRPVTDVIAGLMKNGVMATINEDIDYDTAAVIASDFGLEVERAAPEEAVDKSTDQLAADKDAVPRPPVVTVLGHVDHGKTSLLDALREANVVAGEAGGITQHIGAYQVSVKPKAPSKEKQKDPAKGAKEQLITFLDTPGHEAFTAMRAHGTKLTDVAVLVVAADDGVKPQTTEAIQHIKHSRVPFLVAVTKIDKEGADLNKVKQQLASHDVVAEDWGGDVVFVPTSAKTKEGLDSLLEMLLLVSELAEPKANPGALLSGVVIESRLSRAKGPMATILVKNGTLNVGDYVVVGEGSGRIRLMENFQGKRVTEALPGTPVQVAGLSSVPSFGDAVFGAPDERTARQLAAAQVRESRARKIHRTSISAEAIKRAVDRGKVKQLPIVLVADVKGSLEAIEHSLAKIPQDEVSVQLVSTSVGAISESDVRQAASSHAMIVGFRARVEATAKTVAKQLAIQITGYDIIYKLLDDIKTALEALLPPAVVVNEVGRGEVLAVFRTTKKSQIIGCRVDHGKFVASVRYRLNDAEESGSVSKLKHVNEEVAEVGKGSECGVTIEGPPASVGDRITLYRETTKPRTLTVTT